ncbi:preprotein translocase subunit SecA [Tsukamurella pulmonis]|uniref:DUF5926 domain-containing protein n=1 Tax=Tsukamurella pulmonis TaxID=47312 RepID=A0A1H1HTA4_9ACTN|nr:DUF5926 family protein [Tsukamurella pulmonis]KXO94392.1 preprotein translocase subunit SecA [Tsukamurella pulmonis]KXP11791.1 preprotein translocase subunit SecA [Tsukamurella pulmonis]RDH12250.1 hypothetical protein DVB88_08545 [Tsukamurella pulmonis]SDR28652.1 hypothetical protein SAMN04489765_4568 [Tsukamurella pulmonis]SUP13249.1 Uncharacterised protein [Tsukamurella pulmonis]
MGRRERNATPREGSNRAEKVAAQRARAEASAAASSRPFEGLAAECDIVALRNFVPSATAPLKVSGANREIRLATVLPGAAQALVREESDGVIGYAALQTATRPLQPGAALAGAARFAADAEVGEALSEERDGALLEVLDAAAPLEVTVHKDFDWWLAGDADAQTRQLVEHANSLITPAARIDLGADGVGAPWWADTGSKAHLRWVHPAPEDELMAALARVHAAGGLTVGEGSRFAGSFRSDGLLVPVFDLDRESHPDEWVAGTVELGKRLAEALADDSELTAAQRRSRDGLRGRQVSL